MQEEYPTTSSPRLLTSACTRYTMYHGNLVELTLSFSSTTHLRMVLVYRRPDSPKSSVEEVIDAILKFALSQHLQICSEISTFISATPLAQASTLLTTGLRHCLRAATSCLMFMLLLDEMSPLILFSQVLTLSATSKFTHSMETPTTMKLVLRQHSRPKTHRLSLYRIIAVLVILSYAGI